MKNTVANTVYKEGTGAILGDTFLFWGTDWSGAAIRLHQLRRAVGVARSAIIAAIILLMLGVFLWSWLFGGAVEEIFRVNFWRTPHPTLLGFWFGALAALYGFTRAIRHTLAVRPVLRRGWSREGMPPVMSAAGSDAVKDFPRSRRIDVSRSFSTAAMTALRAAFVLAGDRKHESVGALHIVRVLLGDSSIKVLLGRAAISVDAVAAAIDRLLEKQSPRAVSAATLVSEQWFKILFGAYYYSYKHRREYVTPVALFVAAVREEPMLQEIFDAQGVVLPELENVAAWMRITEQLRERYHAFRSAARLRPKGAMNRAMTALATPELDRVSQDLTETARVGSLPLMIDREQELAEIFRIFEGGGRSVILVGQHGVGKDALVAGIAERMIEEAIPAVLSDKRMVVLSISILIAGVSPAEAQERLLIVLGQIARAGNILLVVPDIHQMVGVSLGEGSDLSDAFAAELSKGYFLCIATTNPKDYTEFVEQKDIGRALERVRIEELPEELAIQALEARAGGIEYEQKVFFSYEALAKAVRLSDKYMHDRYLPEKAIEAAREAAQKVRSERGERQIVTGEDVAAIISDKTGIPATQVTRTESEKLLNLEEQIHARLIGQNEAVKAVAAALRRARTELRSEGRPIANFLFLGPTGVGKTELTKTVAATYFGNEEQMVRLDMSEYQTKESLARLIGAPGERGGGVLTEAIRKQPFTALLLDELEKAHPDILNVFLQVMDDGRLTDNTGRTIDFTNVILIATSNAGSQLIQDGVRAGESIDKIKKKLIDEELKKYYRPEFLNRFDGIIVFRPLTEDEILQIGWLMIGKIQSQLEAKGIKFDVDDEAAEELARAGFDPVFGARPLRRVIQERVQDALANFLLKQKIGRRDKVILRLGGRLEIEKAKEL